MWFHRSRKGLAQRSPAQLFYGPRKWTLVLIILLFLAQGISTTLPSEIWRSWSYPLHYSEEIKQAAHRYDLDPLLICAIIQTESGWRYDAKSDVGAVGLMQVMPETANWLIDAGLVKRPKSDVNRLSDPDVNIDFGSAYLSYLHKNLNNLPSIIAAYNAGLGSVQRWLDSGKDLVDSIDYRETRNYLDRVQDALDGYHKSYTPDLIEKKDEQS